MKARIKSTGEIFPIAPYAKVTLNVCDDRGTPYEVDFEDIELMPDNISESDMDWSSFRREVAKHMLPVTSNWKLTKATGPASIPVSKEAACKLAISYADELIKQLKHQ